MYTLILSLFFAGGGASIDHIDFATSGACERAKSAWLSSISQGLVVRSYSAVCVERD